MMRLSLATNEVVRVTMTLPSAFRRRPGLDRLALLGREHRNIEPFARADAGFGEASHQRRFARVRRGELEQEIENAEELRRASPRLGRQRFDEIDGHCRPIERLWVYLAPGPPHDQYDVRPNFSDAARGGAPLRRISLC